MLFQPLSVLRTPDARTQLLRDDNTEIFDRREYAVELLERFVGRPVPEAVYEELRIEYVLGERARHRPGSGDAISMPSID